MTNKIGPQPGYQTKSLSSEADIVIGGGAAGAGKTWGLLLDPLRGIQTNGFTGMIFRRTTPQIKLPGGLWDTSLDLYPYAGGIPIESKSKYDFTSGASIQFAHLEYEKDKLNHQGSQYAFIGFDELTHFTKTQFLYLLSRNRSTCGIKPYVRCTCNPDAESWVKEVIEWWIDEDGFPIDERDGVLRYFVNDKGNLSWGDSKKEVIINNPHIFEGMSYKEAQNRVMSLTFISGTLEENTKLLEQDPTYKAKLMALPEAEQKALLYGCWKPVQNDLAIAQYKKLMGIFKNNPAKATEKYITCDVARFGRDLAIVKVWDGWRSIKTKIYTKSGLNQLRESIEHERGIYNIPLCNVLIDQDGVGGGLVDEGGYVGFSGGAAALVDPDTDIKENYKNLKTQCYYRMLEEQVNTAEIAIDENFYVDDIKTNEIKIGTKVYEIKTLIIDDLKAIRRANTDKEGKLQINTKEEQKNILGRSPDFGDCIMMRKWFDISGEKEYDFWIM